jgi:hypothetical protein
MEAGDDMKTIPHFRALHAAGSIPGVDYFCGCGDTFPTLLPETKLPDLQSSPQDFHRNRIAKKCLSVSIGTNTPVPDRKERKKITPHGQGIICTNELNS